jgi:Protein of unknown function (DUF2905)
MRCEFRSADFQSGTSRFRLADVGELGKLLIFFGGILVAVGLLLLLFGRTNIPLGRLPGDFVYRGKNTTFYFPLATSIILSVVLSVVLYVVGRLRR